MTELTNALFEAIYGLEDIREVLRQSAPIHELDNTQKERVELSLGRVEGGVKALRRLV